jgi:hypothetical protein
MRYVASLLAGLGMYLLAVMLWDIFGSLYLQYRWQHEHLVVAQVVFKVGSKWDDFYATLPLIIGHVIPIAAFVAGFFWTFRRTSARHST